MIARYRPSHESATAAPSSGSMSAAPLQPPGVDGRGGRRRGLPERASEVSDQVPRDAGEREPLRDLHPCGTPTMARGSDWLIGQERRRWPC